nr:major capsid protein [Caulobacter sp. B11]
MSLVNVFRSSLFQMTELTAAINESETPPQRFAELGIFQEKGVRTTSVFIEKKGSTLSLVPTAPRGDPGTPMHTNKRTGIEFRIPHIPVTDQILADEIQDVRTFGSESDLEGVQGVRDEKLGNMALSLDNTLEYHRLGAVQGLVLDADGSTIYDYFDEFGITEPDTIHFDLDAAWAEADGGRIRGLIGGVKNDIRRRPSRTAQAFAAVLCCGEDFFSKLSNHPECRETYLHSSRRPTTCATATPWISSPMAARPSSSIPAMATSRSRPRNAGSSRWVCPTCSRRCSPRRPISAPSIAPACRATPSPRSTGPARRASTWKLSPTR